MTYQNECGEIVTIDMVKGKSKNSVVIPTYVLKS